MSDEGLGEAADKLVELIVSTVTAEDRKPRPVVFLLGSALTMPPGPGQRGVLGVRDVVGLIRQELGGRAGKAFDEAVVREDFGAAYREGFEALLDLRGQDGADRVVRRAVLEAHDTLQSGRITAVLNGEREACEGLLEEPSGWALQESLVALGQILVEEPRGVPSVLTTNFDPLIEIAVTRAGGRPRRTVLSRDGNPQQHGGDGTHVVYVHGYWFGSDTLHTDGLLTRKRQQLQATLERWFERSLVVVLGYGGWDDVLMASLVATATDEEAKPQIAWGFFGEEDPAVIGKLEAMGGRFRSYEGVDMHRLLPRLRDRLWEERGRSGKGSVTRQRQPKSLEAPYRELPTGDVPGFLLLRAEYRVVRMSGREGALKDLEAWCEGGGLGIRLVTAPGGYGKTRLLRELCERRIELGWTAGVLKHVHEPPAEVVAIAEAGRPMLLAIDYAETWGEGLVALLQGLAPYRKSHGGIRVVLAARAEAEWWQELPHAVPELGDLLARFDAVQPLGPLGDIGEAWTDAVRGFSEWRATAEAVVDPPLETLQAWMKEGVLALHVAALLAVGGEPPPLNAGVEGLFDSLLLRELVKYWRPAARRLLGGTVANLDEALRTVACMGTLIGPLKSLEQARAVLARTSGLRGLPENTLDALMRVLAELYPGAVGERIALPTVQPDRIGERLVATQVEKCHSLASVPFEENDADMAARALRVLGRVARWLPPVLERVVSEHPGALVRAWIVVASEEQWAVALAGRMEAAFGTLEALSPDEADVLVERRLLGSVALCGLAAQLAVRAAERISTPYGRETANEEERQNHARRMVNKSLFLSELGRQEEALDSAEEAVGHYSDLAEQRRDAFLSKLAGALSNLGSIQGRLGRREEALASTEEAVANYRESVDSGQESAESDLAMSLNNLGIIQGKLGRREEALESTAEAVAHYRKLVEHSQDNLPDLAASLVNLGVMQRGLGRRKEALISSTEAVIHYRELVERRRDSNLSNLAASLVNLGGTQDNLGMQEEALVSTQEAVVYYRELVVYRRSSFLSTLATSLSNLGIWQSNLGMREDALASIEEAVACYRELAKSAQDEYLPSLAMVVGNLGVMQGRLEMREESLVAAREAVTLRRELVERWRDAFLPNLASSLINLGNSLSSLGRREEALASMEEAVAFQRELVEHRRNASLPELAKSLLGLSNRQGELNRREEALESAEEATVYYCELARDARDVFLCELATSLNNLGIRQGELGRLEEALASAEEAVILRRELNEQRAGVFEHDLAQALKNLGTIFGRLGKWDKALVLTEEAVTMLRKLADQRPDAFPHELAASLKNLGVIESVLGKQEEALASTKEALAIYQVLVQRWPDAFAPELDMCLGHYLSTLGALGRSPDTDPLALSARDLLQHLTP